MSKIPVTSSSPCSCRTECRERPDLGADIVECSLCNHRWYVGEPRQPLENPDFTSSQKTALFDAAPYVDYARVKRRQR
jgi:hypothetical protein